MSNNVKFCTEIWLQLLPLIEILPDFHIEGKFQSLIGIKADINNSKGICIHWQASFNP